MQLGIVGLPNVGKSTLFNALTKANAEVADYPFTTIDKNVGVAEVPDPRLKRLGEMTEPEKLTGACIEYVDIAGLVKGSSKGEGLGNRFLAHIREVDCILHVLRGFRKGNVAHVDGTVDPMRDAEVINTELALADLESVDSRLEKSLKLARSHDREAEAMVASLSEAKSLLDSGDTTLRMENPPPGLLSSKPVLYVLNMDESDIVSRNLAAFDSVRGYASGRMAGACAVSAKSELELAELETEERASMRKELGLAGFGLDELLLESYRILDLITFYTIKGTETRAWHVRSGSNVSEAAGKIHTEMREGFIKAEIVGFEGLVRHGSMQDVRREGLLRIEGKDYVVRDGDIVLIKFRA
jgi:GTP-binding protein YchF